MSVGWGQSYTENFTQEVINIPELETLKTMYPIAVLKPAELTAKRFMDFVLSESGQAILDNYGFGRPYEN